MQLWDSGLSRRVRPLTTPAFQAGAILAIVLLLNSCADAQTGSAKRGPRIKVAEEIFPFGIVPEKGVVSHVFWLRNTGDEPLEITKLVPNCGCTEAPLEKKHAAPGDSIRVEIAFGSGLYHGFVEKFVQIESNAAGRVPALTFRSHVAADSEPTGSITMTPRSVDLGLQMADSARDGWNTVVKLRNITKSPLAINIVERPDRQVGCNDFSGRLGAGEERQILLHFEPDLPKLVISKSVTFEAIGADTTRVTLPIFQKAPWGSKPGGTGAKTK